MYLLLSYEAVLFAVEPPTVKYESLSPATNVCVLDVSALVSPCDVVSSFVVLSDFVVLSSAFVVSVSEALVVCSGVTSVPLIPPTETSEDL